MRRQMAPNRSYEGLFVTLEGGDGCGKSTVAARLIGQLQQRGYAVFKTREPGGSPLSEQIRHILLNPKGEYAIEAHAELLLYLAARAQNYEQNIKPALHRGEIVICERFHDSSIAYQGNARLLGMVYVEELCTRVAPHPDFTLLLDLDPQEGMKRIRTSRQTEDRLEQEKIQFHTDVRQGYWHIADAHPERVALIDASEPLETVVATAWAALEPHLMLKR